MFLLYFSLIIQLMVQLVNRVISCAAMENVFLKTGYVTGSLNALMVMTKKKQCVSHVLLSLYVQLASVLTWKMFVTE